MKPLPRLVATRALNYLRSVHMPTYVALRFLLESTNSTDAADSLIPLVQQLAHGKSPRILKVQRFKEFDDKGQPEYRSYSVPSPTHALAEAYALHVLRRERVIDADPKDFVYSYRPPADSHHPRNFEHFSIGYAARNQAVQNCLDGDELVAVIFDIARFYPSVDADKAIATLNARCAAAKLGSEERRVVAKALESCRESPGPGLRVGPELSHVLANVAFEHVDRACCDRYPKRYFRYVDDIVVVVRREELGDVRKFIGDQVAACGWELNRRKDAYATRQEWSQFRNEFRSFDGELDPLSKLKFRVKVLLAREPAKAAELNSELNEHGIFLPIRGFQEAVAGATWRDRVKDWAAAGWPVLLGLAFDSREKIVADAVSCQQLVLSQFGALSSQPIQEGVARRWQVQKARFVINRALYFARSDQLSAMREFAAAFSELAESQAVLDAIVSMDFQTIGKMPGPAANAAAQIAALRQVPGATVMDSLRAVKGKPAMTEVLSAFSVRGFSQDSELIDPIHTDVASVLRVSSGAARPRLTPGSASYGAEVEWLASKRDLNDVVRTAESRLLPGEEIVLDALHLSSAYQS